MCTRATSGSISRVCRSRCSTPSCPSARRARSPPIATAVARRPCRDGRSPGDGHRSSSTVDLGQAAQRVLRARPRQQRRPRRRRRQAVRASSRTPPGTHIAIVCGAMSCGVPIDRGRLRQGLSRHVGRVPRVRGWDHPGRAPHVVAGGAELERAVPASDGGFRDRLRGVRDGQLWRIGVSTSRCGEGRVRGCGGHAADHDRTCAAPPVGAARARDLDRARTGRAHAAQLHDHRAVPRRGADRRPVDRRRGRLLPHGPGGSRRCTPALRSEAVQPARN